MTDTDRRLDDIEKRLARLERAAEKPSVSVAELTKRPERQPEGARMFKAWCDCGRDICRAPDCPSHKPDPLGR